MTRRDCEFGPVVPQYPDMNRWTRLGLVVLILIAALAGITGWVRWASDQARLLRACRTVVERANQSDFLKLDEFITPELRDGLDESGGLKRISQILVRADLMERARYEFVGLRGVDLKQGAAEARFRRITESSGEQPVDVFWRRTEQGWKVTRQTLDAARTNTPAATEYLGL
jgi:hypothetical protein